MPINYQQQRDEYTTRLAALANNLTRTNQILSGMKNLAFSFDENGSDPARSTKDHIYVNSRLMGDLARKDTLVNVLGLNYHELAHVLYTPPLSQIGAMNRGMRTAYNILEEGRIETRIIARYGKFRDYLTYPVLKYLVEDETQWPTAFILTHGRKYLPRSLRDTMRREFEKDPNKAAYSPELATLIDQYRKIGFDQPYEFRHARRLIERLMEIMSELGLSMESPCESTQTNGTPDYSDSDLSEMVKQMTEKEEKEESEGKDSSGKSKSEEDDNESDDSGKGSSHHSGSEEQEEGPEEEGDEDTEGSESDSEDSPEDEEGEGTEDESEPDSGPDSDSEDQSGEDDTEEVSTDPNDSEEDPDGTEGESSEGDEDSGGDTQESGSSEAGSEDGSGSEENGPRGEGGEGSGDGEEGDSGTGAGSEDSTDSGDSEGGDSGHEGGSSGTTNPGENGETPYAVDEADIKNLMNALTADILDNEAVKDYTDSIEEAMEDYSSVGSLLDSAPHRLSHVTSDMMFTSEAVADEIRRVWAQLAPGWKESDQGVVNMSRAADAFYSGDLYGDDIYDEWDSGAQDSTGISLYIGADCSLSMYEEDGNAQGETRLKVTSQVVWMALNAFKQLDADVVVTAFDTDSKNLYQRDESVDPGMYKAMEGGGGTDPSRMLDDARRILGQSENQHKVLLLVTDGSFNRRPYGWGSYVSAVDATRVAVIIGNDIKTAEEWDDKAGFDLVLKCSDIIDLLGVMAQLVTKILERAVNN